ncbi:DUF5361 domain-containing protein [Yinghuangia soli]|uniref:DUF5361 domain-containing protein n=1 Tax=Yinghuangia soli TaxID=2908204 RepID=A0AA41Q6X7_9ACTN|nr:DUF5361 domain-containing protein [Yinghuangia soli]MCF2532720.1 DUF5361 domain-containing protein [Yinghuangia soli]
MDLLDWHRGTLSSRRLQVLIAHLPQDAHVMRAIHGESAEWSLTDHLLAATVDHLAVANWMFAAVNRDEDSEIAEYPTPIPRPGIDEDRDEDADYAEADFPTSRPSELAAFFSR